MSKEAMIKALGDLQAGYVGNAMQILREALAEQPAYRAVKTFHEGKPVYVAEQPAQQEPVAAECKFDREEKWVRCEIAHHNLVQSEPEKWPGYQTRLLYTSPPAQRTWVGLTDEQIDRLWSQSLADTESETWLPLREFARAIEAAHGITKE